MILLHFPFILSGDLQTKSWGLAVVLCICVCSKVVVGETTQLVHISSWTQLSNHPRLTLFSGVNAWGCLLVVKFTSKHPVAGSTLELGNKCSFSACRLLCITVWDVVTNTSAITSQRRDWPGKPHRVELCSCQWSTLLTGPASLHKISKSFFFRSVFPNRLRAMSVDFSSSFYNLQPVLTFQ